MVIMAILVIMVTLVITVIIVILVIIVTLVITVIMTIMLVDPVSRDLVEDPLGLLRQAGEAAGASGGRQRQVQELVGKPGEQMLTHNKDLGRLRILSLPCVLPKNNIFYEANPPEQPCLNNLHKFFSDPNESVEQESLRYPLPPPCLQMWSRILKA